MIVPRLTAHVVLLALSVAVLLINIYPYHPTSLAGWGLLAVLSLPLILAGEFFGEKLLGPPFVAKLPRPLRITYGVVVLAAVMAAMMFAWPLLEPHLGKWGQ